MSDLIIIAGIDPGLSGAISFYMPFVGKVAVYDMPVIANEISPSHLAGIIRTHMPSYAVLEKVGAMPGQGVVSMFNFGRSVGEVRGVLGALGIPLHQVTPRKWKTAFGLDKDKDACRLEAVRIFPDKAGELKRKKDHNRAEAILLAYYGSLYIKQQESLA